MANEYINAKDLQEFRDELMDKFLSLCNYNDFNKMSDTDYVKKDMVVMAIKPCSVYRHTEPFNPAKIAKDYSVPQIKGGSKT